MNGWQFMGEHPFLTFFLALIAANLLAWPFRLINRWIRHRNIAKAGWPPNYLDADGDTQSATADTQ